MIVSYYNPDMISPKWPWLFCKYLPDINFLNSGCEKNVDFIYCGSPQVLPEGLESSKKYNRPIVCWVWDITDPTIFTDKWRGEQRTEIINSLKKCSLVLSASKHTQQVLETYGIKSEQLYFYVDIEAVSKAPEIEKQNTIIQVGRIVPHKQIEVTLAAAAGLDIPVHIYGTYSDKAYTDHLFGVASLFNVNIQMNINNSQLDVLTAIKRAKVLVHSSVFEGFGMPPIEAVLCGTPPIVSDLPVFREQYGDAILYHKIGHPADLRSQIIKLLEMKNQEEYLKPLHNIVSEYTPEKFAQRWIKVITEHLG